MTCTAKRVLQGLASRTSNTTVMMASRTFASDNNKSNGKLSGKIAIVTALLFDISHYGSLESYFQVISLDIMEGN